MDDMLYQVSPRFLLDQRMWSPQMDILETPESFMIIADVSGLQKEKIQITVKKNLVHLSGKRERPPMGNAVRYLQMEIEYGSFERTFELPVLVDEVADRGPVPGRTAHRGFAQEAVPKKTIPIQSE